MKKIIMLTLVSFITLTPTASAVFEQTVKTNYLWAILAAVIIAFVIIFITTVIGNKKR